MQIEDEALREVISGYTREAGVRSLERQIGRICRKSARKILEEQVKEVVVTKEHLEEFLGKERYEFQPANEKPEIGIVRGLAWTAVGGDTLQIEVNVMPGKGEFLLTGQLGDVMTGEITLRGRVLPIGGLKEKLLAAKKAGMQMVLVPEKNEPDVKELDTEITEGLQIEFVSSMEQVLKLALVKNK